MMNRPVQRFISQGGGSERSSRALLLQVLVIVALLAFLALIASNVAANLAKQNIAPGFAFLDRRAGFDISQKLVEYTSAMTYGRAFLVGLVNTVVVAGIGIVFATALGISIGLMRLSPNWLAAKLATVYVETIRNIPLLLLLFFIYFGVLRSLPGPRESIDLPFGMLLNVRGLFFPKPVGVFEWEYPALGKFNVEGGWMILPEFAALLFGLTIYTAAFIAEIVRAGINGVDKGQREAAMALGLSRGQAMRLVILPQALRIIIPPLTNQYLNLTKNSSLAIAIGYPDLVSVFAGTVLNQTNQAVEVILITMAVYLTLSLATAAAMNWFNARMALTER